LRHIFTAHAQKRLSRTSDQKSDPDISSGDIDFLYKTGIFPLSDDVFGIYLMFCAQFSFDLVTLTFNLLTLAVSEE